MSPTLSNISTLLGVVAVIAAFLALAMPEVATGALRKFPRAVGIGCVLVLVSTGWFVFNLQHESIADFESIKPHLTAALVALGVATCIFVRDLIAIRGLAVLMLLVANAMLNAGRPLLGTSPLVLVNQSLAYVLVVLGMWLTIAPWRLRDWLTWIALTKTRLRVIGGFAGGLGVFLVVTGMTVFRQLK